MVSNVNLNKFFEYKFAGHLLAINKDLSG